MSAIENARMLLVMAGKDIRVMAALVGFHAQRAVE